MQGVVSFLVTDHDWDGNYYVKQLNEAHTFSNEEGFFVSRWKPFVVASHAYVSLGVSIISAIYDGIVTGPVKNLALGNVEKAWESLSEAFVGLVHCIKRLVIFPFFIIAGIFAPQAVYGAMYDAVKPADEPDASENPNPRIAELESQLAEKTSQLAHAHEEITHVQGVLTQLRQPVIASEPEGEVEEALVLDADGGGEPSDLPALEPCPEGKSMPPEAQPES